MPGFYISMTLVVSTWRHWHKLIPKGGKWTTSAGTRIRWFRWGPLELSGWRYNPTQQADGATPTAASIGR